MSKIVFLCRRYPNSFSNMKMKLESLSKKLIPDNITASPPLITENDGVMVAVYNPNETILIHGTSVCLGKMVNENKSWWEPNQEFPDGTYALFRNNDRYIEIISDVVASRTIWYFMDDQILISSTSQRAIIYCLNNYFFNQRVTPWMLSTGTLGPGASWDSRIKRIPGDSSIIIDRMSWTMSSKSSSFNFAPVDKTAHECEELLRGALLDTFDAIKPDYSKWILLLSGGYDSRGILCLLKDRANMKTVTWGLRESLVQKDNDAYVARQLAKFYHLPHHYFETDLKETSIETIFNRFLVCGEGRVDHIAGYMDGFLTWKTLFENGIQGIIRGDEGFGWLPVSSHYQVRQSVGLLLYSDFRNLKILDTSDFTQQSIPGDLLQKEDESLELWRDRLYHEFRIPLILAALNDLKLPYVEIMNPFLCRRIIYQVRCLPDGLRTSKTLYKKIIKSISPAIDYAKYPAIETEINILKSETVVNIIREELSSDYASTILPKDFLRLVVASTKYSFADERRKGIKLKNVLKTFIPNSIMQKMKDSIVYQQMDFNVLAFRTYIICRMHKMLSEDVNMS